MDPVKNTEVVVNTNALSFKSMTGTILTSEKFTDINSFEKPDQIVVADFKGFTKNQGGITIKLPPMSVVVLEFK